MKSIFLLWLLFSGVARAGSFFTLNAYSPNQEPGRALWLSACSLSALADGTGVSLLADCSGLGHDATQPTSSARPTFKVGVIAGRAAIYMDGVDDGMITTLSVASPYSIYLVAQALSTGDTRIIQSGENNRLITYGRSFNAVYVGGAVTDGVDAGMAVGALLVGADSRWYLNGVDQTTNSTLGGTDWGTIRLGISGTTAETALCYIGEVFVLTNNSAAARLRVSAFFRSRYGTP